MNPKENALKHGIKLMSWVEMDKSGVCKMTRFGIELNEFKGRTEQEAIDKALEYIVSAYGDDVEYEYIIEYQLEGDTIMRRSKKYYRSAEEFICSNPEVVYSCEDDSTKRVAVE